MTVDYNRPFTHGQAGEEGSEINVPCDITDKNVSCPGFAKLIYDVVEDNSSEIGRSELKRNYDIDF